MISISATLEYSTNNSRKDILISRLSANSSKPFWISKVGNGGNLTKDLKKHNLTTVFSIKYGRIGKENRRSNLIWKYFTRPINCRTV